jgi:hypothetical protein
LQRLAAIHSLDVTPGGWKDGDTSQDDQNNHQCGDDEPTLIHAACGSG